MSAQGQVNPSVGDWLVDAVIEQVIEICQENKHHISENSVKTIVDKFLTNYIEENYIDSLEYMKEELSHELEGMTEEEIKEQAMLEFTGWVYEERTYEIAQNIANQIMNGKPNGD